MQKILIVEDDTNINNLLRRHYQKKDIPVNRPFQEPKKAAFEYAEAWLCIGIAGSDAAWDFRRSGSGRNTKKEIFRLLF